MNGSSRLLAVSIALGLFTLAAFAFLFRSAIHSQAAAIDRSPIVGDEAPTPSEQINVAMSAAFVSEAGVGVYADIVDYLEQKTGLELNFITGLSYRTIDEMVDDGFVGMAFVCGYPYVLRHDREPPIVDLLVAPVPSGERYGQRPIYYSDLIVRADSPYQSLEDLEGRTYVYNDEFSNSGYNMPRHFLLKKGLAEGFFGKVVRSGSHEESIRMVAEGRADASFVDSLVLDFDRQKGLGEAENVRVIQSRGPAPIPPVAVSHELPQPTRRRLTRALLEMHEDPDGRALLDRALLSKFVRVEDDAYDSIRRWHEEAHRAGVVAIRAGDED